MSTLDQG